jgi:hypothetical protein
LGSIINKILGRFRKKRKVAYYGNSEYEYEKQKEYFKGKVNTSMLIFFSIIGMILSAGYLWLETPTLAWGFGGINILLIIWAFVFYLGGIDLKSRDMNSGCATLATGLIGCFIVYCFILPFLTTAPIAFHAKSYQQMLGKVNDITFDEHIAQIDNSQIRIVDENTAHKLADQKIGTMGAAGSEVQIGKMELQKVRGQLYWVAPIEYRGFVQWFNGTYSNTGTPGYVMVNATNQNDIKLINKDADGKDMFIKYQPNAYGWQDVERHLYFNGYMTKGLADFTFEIDDNLTPYWAVTVFEKKVGWSGRDAVGVALVNAQTGEIKYYDINDVPEWVDRIQPEEFVMEQISDWGEYVKGYLNSTPFGSKIGTLKPASNRLHLTYGADGQCYWYTGITSTSKDESTTGFMLVNSRTKEVKYVHLAGKQEPAAKRSADAVGKPHFMTSGDIILYNIGGKPTYITPMKNSEGLTAGVAAILVEDYNIVGFGKDIDSAITNYRQVLASKGNVIAPSASAKQVELKGNVERIAELVREGQTYYYITINGRTEIFVGAVTTSDKLPLTRPNDMVLIKYDETKDRKVNMTDFDNLNINLNPPTTQQTLKEQAVKQ